MESNLSSEHGAQGSGTEGGGQPPRLLDQVRQRLRLKHYSLKTEQSYCGWIRRYVKFHEMKSRVELQGGEAKIEAFLSHLAVAKGVSASTQNQAFNALLFLYREVLN